MPIQFFCENCSTTYPLNDSTDGNSLVCKRCGKVLWVPQVVPFESPLETATSSPKPLFLNARMVAIIFGLGLMLGPSVLWCLIFIFAPSRRSRGGRGEPEGLFLLGGMMLLLAVGTAILGWRLVRLAVGPVASESDLRSDSEHRSDEDNALTELQNTQSVGQQPTTTNSLPTAPIGVLFEETESGWSLTAPITSNGTTIVSGLLLALSSYGTFKLLSLIGFDVLVLGIALGVILAFGWQFARSGWGTLRISCHGNQFAIFQGVGSLGSTQTFDATHMPEIKEATVSRKYASGKVIQLTGATQIHFGELLSAENRDFIRSELYRLMLEQKKR